MDANGIPNDWGAGYNMTGTSSLGQLASGQSRYLSIINTGWDPALGIQYYTYSFSGGDGSIFKRQMEMASIRYGQQDCINQSPSAVASCIQQVYNSLAQQETPGMEGGNYDFSWKDQSGNLLISINGQGTNSNDFNCPSQRCGGFDTIYYSNNNCTFYIDTANSWYFPMGTIAHTIIDVLGGQTWWRTGGIPRFP